MLQQTSGSKRLVGGGNRGGNKGVHKRTHQNKKLAKNGKGRCKIEFVGENDKPTGEKEMSKLSTSFSNIKPGIHFKISKCPTGMKGESPIFRKIEEIPANEDIRAEEGMHNCVDTMTNRKTWLSGAVEIIIVDA